MIYRIRALPSEPMMTDDYNHLSERQLRELLFESEERLDSTDIALHIETCQTCQMRLNELADENSIEHEACQMLSGYTEALRNPDSRSLSATSNLSESDLSFDRAVLEPPTHPEMLGRIGRYEVERCIGSGGMGVVFKAIDTELNRPVAVKVLAPHLARNGAARQRFSRESRAAAAVVHEHVVAIHNVDSNVEYPYLVMQYVSGESLQSRVDREGPLSVERILRIGIQTALGLAAAHQQGIVHRDIKPANILLEDGVDRLLITDFGLARTVDDASLTHTGVVAGTPNYMSPEQAKGEETDQRTDLFSLGSVLYFVATGHSPFRAERAMGVLNRICHERHRPVWQVNATVPDELSMAIDRLLEKRPSRRYANAESVAESLTRILQQLQNRQPSLSTRLRSWGRRNQRSTTIAASVALIACVWLVWSVFSTNNLRSTLSQLFSGNIDSLSSKSDAASLPGNDQLPSGLQSLDTLDIPANQLGSDSPSSASSSSISTMNIVTTDRAEFDESIRSINQALNLIIQATPSSHSDPTSDLRRELDSLEQILRSIDPSSK
jgi:eukaryotic-like serine/threonine-protein kinase